MNKGGAIWIGFLIGLLVGGIFGVIVMALMNAASRADKSMREHDREMDDDPMYTTDTLA